MICFAPAALNASVVSGYRSIIPPMGRAFKTDHVLGVVIPLDPPAPQLAVELDPPQIEPPAPVERESPIRTWDI